MFLILEDSSSDFTEALAVYAEKRGLNPVILSSSGLARETSISFRLNDCSEELLLESGSRRIQGNDITGCFCLIHTFSPSLWPGFSEHDAVYAAGESHAMWLSILHSLKSRMVNPPAPDSLAGTVLSSTELFFKASHLGIDVPMVIYTESSEGVNELLLTGYTLLVSDLNELSHETRVLSGSNGGYLSKSPNCHLVMEAFTGRQYCICIAGESVFVSAGYNKGKPVPARESIVPREVIRSLRSLASAMNLNLCEFFLVKNSLDEWIMQSSGIMPLSTWCAHGDSLLQGVLDVLPGKNREEMTE